MFQREMRRQELDEGLLGSGSESVIRQVNSVQVRMIKYGSEKMVQRLGYFSTESRGKNIRKLRNLTIRFAGQERVSRDAKRDERLRNTYFELFLGRKYFPKVFACFNTVRVST